MASGEDRLVQRERFKGRDNARLAVFSYIEGFYNPHAGTRLSATVRRLSTRGCCARTDTPLYRSSRR